MRKLIVVTNTRDLEKIRGEVETLSEDFRKSLAYMEARDVKKASELSAELNSIVGRLELVKYSQDE